MIDVKLTNHGTVVILEPQSVAAQEWCAENLPEDAPRWGRDGYAIEPRCVVDILYGLADAGLDVSP